MSIAELQLKLHQTIDNITDSKKLNALYALLEGSEKSFSPSSLKEYIDAIDTARDEIRTGKSNSIEDLEKESESW
jgi:hypothetical protein